ncbi:hypothetical protein GCM10010520_27220 [Rhizobium viscosum]|uniref:Uncharacterized protein n=1 Tax=Rhizobium viscosum TaxID=1673 RepID=A0ABR9IKQ4_RHIVS|nr:hypothetical protein [Rhizobium viscosum]MBE1503497.1 hypothetical protein [Rhizobium viscosum]
MSMLEFGIAHLIVTRGVRKMPPLENADLIRLMVRAVIALATFAGLIAALQMSAGT